MYGTLAAAPPPTAIDTWPWSAIARERGSAYRVDQPDKTLSARLGQVLDEVCEPARLEALADEELEAQVAVARRLEGAAALLVAHTVRELNRRGVVRGPASTEWLKATGRSGKEAAKSQRLASALDDMPATAQALAEGRIGSEAADTVVRAARDTTLGSPDVVEDTLLPVAVDTTPEDLRAEVRRREQQVEPDAMLRDERRQHARRRLSVTRRDDGVWDLYARLTGEVGTRVRAWLDAFEVPDPKDTPPEQRRRPEQRLADAFDTAVSAALGAGTAPQTGGVVRPHLSVIVDVTTFDADLTDPDDPDRPVAPGDALWTVLPGGEVEWGGALSPQAIRRLCCDAAVSRVVMAGESQVLDAGRATRQWSAAQRRAVRARDRHCRGPDCRRPIGWTEIHHLQWWRNDGHTAIDNGLSLCHGCHRLVHDVGWHAELDVTTGAVTWTSPDRRRTVVRHPRRAA